MPIHIKGDVFYFHNKPTFEYLDIVSIRSNNIISVLSGNIKAKYKGKIVHGIMDESPKCGWYKVQLIKLL